MDISVIILTKNEEKNISNCLASISFASEIIVIDDYSTDNTVKIATKFGAKIYPKKLSNNFSALRNFGLSKASNKWVLFLDSDEVVSNKLAGEISNLNCSNINGFYILRRDVFMNEKIMGGENGGTWLMRFAKKDKGKWRRAVHEEWNIKGETRKLKNIIYHSPHPTMEKFVQKINRYSNLHAIENKRENKNVNIFKILLYPVFKFLNIYLFKLGFRDNTRGFVLAMMMSFHSFLSWSTQYIDEK